MFQRLQTENPRINWNKIFFIPDTVVSRVNFLLFTFLKWFTYSFCVCVCVCVCVCACVCEYGLSKC